MYQSFKMIFCGMNCKNMAKVWKIPDNFLYLHCLKIGVMRTVQDYMAIIRQIVPKLLKILESRPYAFLVPYHEMSKQSKAIWIFV